MGGTGLGLSIAKWIVEKRGGTLGVESIVGHGSTFEVRLPILQNVEREFASKAWRYLLSTFSSVLRLIFDNQHQSRIAAYLVHSLVPRDTDIRITANPESLQIPITILINVATVVRAHSGLRKTYWTNGNMVYNPATFSDVCLKECTQDVLRRLLLGAA